MSRVKSQKRTTSQVNDRSEYSSNKKRKLSSTNLPVKPLGNLLFSSIKAENCREPGLGILGSLPDEVLLSYIFGNDVLSGEDLFTIQRTSKSFFVFCRNEGLWKNLFLQKTGGALPFWRHSFRNSYLLHFRANRIPPGERPTIEVPTETVQIRNFFSDVLFAPYHSASFDAKSLVNTKRLSLNAGKGIVERVEWAPDFQLPPSKPLIFTNLTKDWSARNWTLPSLSKSLPNEKFQAEAVRVTLAEYQAYHDSCPLEESPLYLFDSEFVARMQEAGLERGWECPKVFSEDLFQVFGADRPDYRWLIIGPERSGSSFHQDPNHTSAWNAVITGSKWWIMFPPDVTPPGVRISDDMAEVSCPFSNAEWLINYYQIAANEYGPKAKDPNKRGKMLEGICRSGETFYVPSAWWHFVINLEPSIAITQNFVGPNELGKVLYFLKHRSSQISGFRCPEGDLSGLYQRFVDKLSDNKPEVLKLGLEQLKVLEQGNDVRQTKVMKLAPKQGKDVEEDAAPFTFNFQIDP
ncbi:Clavaminate synthase-like protein [Atractiella rhizophila]|nr:Clavaminate synthase-like protein [Atractiella rhizophila]